LATIAGSGTSQKFILISQLFMESQHSKSIESIRRHFYNIPPIPGSLHLVLISPDPEIAPQNLPIAKIPPAYILPLTSPLSTIIRTSWRVDSRPLLRAESACRLCLAIGPLVVPLLEKSDPIFEDPEHFCCSYHNHFLLQLELRARWILNQFCTLNPPVNSICS